MTAALCAKRAARVRPRAAPPDAAAAQLVDVSVDGADAGAN